VTVLHDYKEVIVMVIFREIKAEDDSVLADIVRSNLKANKLDIPGTAYFDDNLNHLSEFYLENRSKRFYCVVEEDGNVIGGVGLDRFEYFEDCAEMQKLYLTDSAKGRGIGYKMIGVIEDKARELGYKKLYLETHSNLQVAIHIYKKCGYKEIEKPKDIVHATMDRFFVKDLL
jgi:putative acetyltransferase